MANYLKMETKQAVLTLLKLNWSYRRIERELGVRRETISKYHQEEDSKAAKVAPGSEGEKRPEWPPGMRSLCDAHRELIDAKLEAGLTAKRIYQDLVFEHGFIGAYNSVKRYCRRRRQSTPEVYARVEVVPGQQMQVDFSRGAPTRLPGMDKYRRPHLFRAVLSYSRHSYEEVVWHQDLATFIGCFQRAFETFGGVVDVVTIDNLKAGVTNACFYDPEINPVFAAYASHTGFAVLPIRPKTPRLNGKVERGHGYAKSSALRGRKFESLEDQNRHLVWWNQNVARMRIHGTTKQQVWARFEQQEKGALHALPSTPFRLFRSGTRTVSPDGHVEVDRAFYSVPHQYLGLELRVDWDDHLVKIYRGQETVAVHPRTSAGRFQTEAQHLPEQKRYVHLKLERHLLKKAQAVGPEVLLWAEGALATRGVLAYRVLQGVLSLTRKHPAGVVNRACSTALHHGAFRYRTVAELCKRQQPEQKVLFTTEHELIRPLAEYEALLQGGACA
jgi:transposase